MPTFGKFHIYFVFIVREKLSYKFVNILLCLLPINNTRMR